MSNSAGSRNTTIIRIAYVARRSVRILILPARFFRVVAATRSGSRGRPPFLRFSVKDQILFSKRLGMILRAGIPILEGLHMLASEAHSRSAKFIYRTLVTDISRGQSLSYSLEKFSDLFGEFTINVIRVGEASGTLHENLEYLANELKQKQALRRKVIGALVYPAVIVTASIGIIVLLTVYIFPKILPIFQSVKAQLPITTRFLMATSTFLTSRGILLLVAVVLLVGAYFALMKVKRFHYLVDCVLVRLPIAGSISRYYNLANISRTLGLLLRSDVRISTALELVADGTRNLLYKRSLLEARESVLKGQKLSAQFKRWPVLFPPTHYQMVMVGESTGNLGATLTYSSDMYEEEIADLTKNLTTLLEPLLMIVMGVIVGFIAISIITPIYSITQSLTPR